MDLSNCTTVSPKYVERLSLYYSHVTGHVITADGKLLLAAIKAGYLAVFPIRSYLKDIFLSSEISSAADGNSGDQPLINCAKRLKPISLIQMSNSLSLQLDKAPPKGDSSQYKLVTGGQGSVQGHILSQSNQLESSWSIKLPSDNTLANAISLSDERIFTGCSDNNVYVHDKETQKEVAKLTGHQDYLHALKVTSDHQLYSASEDGSVRCWDLRSPKECTSVILPFKKGYLERAQFGKWIGAIDVSPNGEWLVCGGGPKLSVWHLVSGKCVHSVDTPNVAYVAQFHPADHSSIVFAGNGNRVSTWNMTSESPSTNQIDSSIDSIYSIVHHDYANYNYNLSSFSGDSFKLELCKNGKYIDSALFVA